jgi:arylsulfatase A-like enzyme
MLRRILDSPWLYFGLAAVLVVVGLASQIEVRLPPRPAGTVEDIAKLRERKDLNVVLILIDTLRADHLTGFGYGRPTSPFLDRLMADGVRFTNVEAQSTWTKSSMASLWTSFWPIQTGILRWDQSLPGGAPMPAKAFKTLGFQTAGIYRNGWLAPKFGFGQGFDVYYKPSASATPAKFQHRNPSAHPLTGSDADITVSTAGFLNSYGRDRFFLYLHMMDVHQYAYDASSPVFGTSYVDFYDSAIAWVDHNVGVMAKSFDDHRLLDHTVFVIASDHGEEFGEHGLEGHARNLYDEVTHVPLIISFPFALPDGIVVDQLVRNVDIVPTILDLVGLPLPEGSPGHSLVPLIEAAGRGQPITDAPPPAFAHLDLAWGQTEHPPNPIVSVKTPDWKLIHALNGTDPEQLYDEKKDPKNLRNVATQEAAPLAVLKPLISQYLATPPASWGTPDQVQIESQQLEQLKALGYIIK